MPRPAPKPTGWQRFLQIVSFGLLGKPTSPPPRPAPSAARPRPEALNRPASAPARSQPAAEGTAPRPRTPIRPLAVTTGRLYVGNLSYDASESDLVELFSGVGKVRNAEIVYNRRTHRSKGYAFVQMQSVEEARRAVEELHDREYMGRKMLVSGAKDPQEDRETEATASR